ncbi:hypothetical protein B9057_15050 (plasmid) [Aestuarium zhoushanense]|nr:hypothetical protein B9057_15050 [Aestuarium zhoushanense]
MTFNLTKFVMYFVLLNAAKIPLAFLGFHHSLASFLQLSLILSFGIAILINENGKVGDLFSSAFFLYHAVMIMKQYLLFTAGANASISSVAISLSASRVLSLYFLYIIFKHRVSNFNGEAVLKILIFYLALTSTVSALQTPLSPLSEILISRLNDITSGNHLGYFRSTGGVGGTVIDYAVYLSFCSLLFFIFRHQKKKILSMAYIIAFGFGVYFAFSRSLFVISVFVISMLTFTYGRRIAILTILLFAILIIIKLDIILHYLNLIQELSAELSGQSDVSRLNGWSAALNEVSVVEILFGVAVGVNSGFGSIGGKVSGDGFAVTYIAEYGVFGLILLALMMYKFLTLFYKDGIYKLISFLALAFTILVNSGFEKVFNYGYFFIIIATSSFFIPKRDIVAKNAI